MRAAEVEVSTPAAAPSGRRWSIKRLLIGLAILGCLAVSAGIFITINKDGQSTTVEVPDGSHARVDADGNVNVDLSGGVKSSKPAGSQPPAAQQPAAAKPKLSFERPVVRDVSRYEDFPGRVDVSQGSLYAVFDVDERTVLRARRLVQAERSKSEPAWEFPVLWGLSDDKGHPNRSKVESVDVNIDPNTGTARWRALLPNPDGILTPGMFVRVRVVLGPPAKALLIPESALGTDQGRRFVYVVNDRDVIEYRPVQIGQLDDGLRVVEEGLTTEDLVVTSGREKLRPGMTVQPEQAPAAEQPEAAPGQNKSEPAKQYTFRTAAVTRGDLVVTVGATGTIEPEEVVDVSAQVAGRIIQLGNDPRGKTDPQYAGKPVDYGSPVEQNMMLAKLDPLSYKNRRDAATAALECAQAAQLQITAKFEQADRAWKRAQEMRTSKGISDTDYDQAETNYKTAKAGVAGGEATLRQAKIELEQAEADLCYTTIISPVKGVILARRASLGQNVGPIPGAPPCS